jgi:5-(carboxyamino)imidazole ribonucleotide mutase
MTASLTTLPVLGVPVESKALKGLDSLLSIAQMPGGVPVATFAVGKAGAINAALFAASLLAQSDARTKREWRNFRSAQTKKVLKTKLP